MTLDDEGAISEIKRRADQLQKLTAVQGSREPHVGRMPGLDDTSFPSTRGVWPLG